MSLDLAIVDSSSSSTSGTSVTLHQRPSGRAVGVATNAMGGGMTIDVVTGETQRIEQGRAGQGDVVSPLEDGSTAAESTSTGRRFLADLVQLTKPRIVVMVLVTTIAAAMVAAGGFFAASELLWLLVGTSLIAGSAGSANQIWEREIDSTMPRTAVRPLPSRRMSVATAAAFTFAIGALGTIVLASAFGLTTASVGLATWILYVLIYTPLKTRTAWNTTVGAIAGALPLLIGFTGLGGSLTDATGWLLLGVLVAWQYPHFMAIAWMYRRQYAEAGFKMTTTVEPSGRSAAWQSIAGSFALIICGVALCVGSDQWASSAFASIAIVLVVYPMLRSAIEFARHRDDSRARRMLRSSLLVLPAVLLIVTLRVFW